MSANSTLPGCTIAHRDYQTVKEKIADLYLKTGKCTPRTFRDTYPDLYNKFNPTSIKGLIYRTKQNLAKAAEFTFKANPPPVQPAPEFSIFACQSSEEEVESLISPRPEPEEDFATPVEKSEAESVCLSRNSEISDEDEDSSDDENSVFSAMGKKKSKSKYTARFMFI